MNPPADERRSKWHRAAAFVAPIGDHFPVIYVGSQVRERLIAIRIDGKVFE